MKISYSDFLEQNKTFPKKSESLLILGQSNELNSCTCMNKKGEKYRISIPVLIRETLKTQIRVIDAWRLKTWEGWGSDIRYPDDYKQNRERYYKKLNTPKLGRIDQDIER